MKLDELDRYAPLFRSMGPSYGDLLRRRERKRRNQRIGAAAVAIVVMLALVGSFAVTYLGSQHVPAEGGGMITPQNVGQLQLRWSADLDGAVPANLNASNFLPYPPTVAGDTVYIGTDSGTLYAFPGSCGTGGATCMPTWTARVKGAVDHAVTAADGHVFASTDAGKLYAFPVDCPATCRPEWVGDVGHGLYSSPVVADGRVYGIDLWNGTLYAFDEACRLAAPERTCSPSWTAWLGSRLQDNLECKVLAWCVVAAPAVADGMVFAGGEGLASEALRAFDAETGELRWKSAHAPMDFIRRYRWPVVDGDRVIVAWSDGVYAFPTRCGTGGVTCDPLWSGLTSFQGQPLVSGGQVVVGADAVYAFPVDCRDDGGVCDPVWASEQPGNLVGQPLGAGGGLVVAPDSGDPAGGITAIGTSLSGERDRLALWRAAVPYPFIPVVTNGVVYVGSGLNEIDAFPIDCRSECPPSWTWSGDSGLSTPTVGTDTLFVAEQSGKLLSFGPGSGEGGGGSVMGSPALPLAVVGAIAIAFAVVLRRRRRLERLLEGP